MIHAASGGRRVDAAALLIELLQQGATPIQSIKRDIHGQGGRSRQLKAALRCDAHVRLGHIELLLLQRFDDVPRGLAVKFRPNRVVRAAEKGCIRAGARYFPDTPGAKWKRKRDIVRHGSPFLALTPKHVIDDGARERPTPAVAWVHLQRDVE